MLSNEPDAVLVFSSHLDDGVLSASAPLMGPGAQLVTVLAGAPPVGLAVTPWGRTTGAASMEQRHAERLQEDERAAAILGCRAIRLEEPEQEFRSRPLRPAFLTARLAPSLRGAREVWAPAAIGEHPDHRLVRDAVLAAWLAERVGQELYLYADLPYALDDGWPPGSVRGADPDVTTSWLAGELSQLPSAVRVRGPLVHDLTTEQRRRKAEAASAYSSQLTALGLGPSATDRWDALLGHEVAWQVTVHG